MRLVLRNVSLAKFQHGMRFQQALQIPLSFHTGPKGNLVKFIIRDANYIPSLFLEESIFQHGMSQGSRWWRLVGRGKGSSGGGSSFGFSTITLTTTIFRHLSRKVIGSIKFNGHANVVWHRGGLFRVLSRSLMRPHSIGFQHNGHIDIFVMFVQMCHTHLCQGLTQGPMTSAAQFGTSLFLFPFGLQIIIKPIGCLSHSVRVFMLHQKQGLPHLMRVFQLHTTLIIAFGRGFHKDARNQIGGFGCLILF
mmetsp:Transcript_22507/g.46905  ORF Transcript_22507/g.46905 Transcript_22507/m.46905 type:complete len:249 (-) Transcript_22507:1570-2316(-)